MSDLRDLYQEVVIDHGRSPRNFGELEPHSHQAEGYNPLCGDKLKLYIQIEDGVVRDARFTGSGCAISTASASILTDAVKGKTPEQAETLFKDFHAMLTRDDTPPDVDKLGKLAVLGGVKAYPTRIKCATLAWHTLHAALQEENQPVTTE